MMELSSKDFSFVSEGLTGALYQMFDKISFKPNLTQNGAIGFICVVDEHPEKVEQLAHEANHLFDVQIERTLLC
jgi:aspartate kinase